MPIRQYPDVRSRWLRRLAESGRSFTVIDRNRTLRRAELSFGGAWTAEWAFTVALGVVAFRHGGATAVGVVTFLRAAPAALFAPLGAAFGDRFPRHRVLVWCCTPRGLAIGAAAALLAADAPIASVYALAVVATAAFVVIRPVHSALLPMLCSSPLELTSANVVRGLIDSLSTLLGPLVAALLLEIAGAEAVFGFAAALCVWSGLLVVGLSYERPARRSSPLRLIGLVNETADGFLALRRHRQAGTVTSIAVAQVFTRGCLNVFLVVIAFDLLDTGDAGVGVLTAAIGAGAVIGSLAVAAMVTGRHLAALEGIGVTLWGLPLVFCAVLPNEPAVLVSMGVVGVGNSLVDVGAVLVAAAVRPGGVAHPGLWCVREPRCARGGGRITDHARRHLLARHPRRAGGARPGRADLRGRVVATSPRHRRLDRPTRRGDRRASPSPDAPPFADAGDREPRLVRRPCRVPGRQTRRPAG